MFYVVFYNLPDHTDLKNHQHIGITKIHDANGNIIAEYAIEKRIFVPVARIPKRVIDAFLSSEDKNFYQHHGIDFMGLARLPLINLFKLFSRQRMQGASTITQQVVKNLLLTNEYSLMRKVKEAILSYKISQELSKDQVLELYLNHSYLGKGSYGVAAAAKTYFNKPLEELSISEAAFLASLPKAPSVLSNPKNYLRVKNRRNYVLNQMLENGFITVDERDLSQSKEILFSKDAYVNHENTGYFSEAVREEVNKLLGEDVFYTSSLSIFTSLNPDYQRQAENIFRENINQYEAQKNNVVFDTINSLEEFYKYKYQSSQMLCIVRGVKPNELKLITKTKQEILLNFNSAFDEDVLDTTCSNSSSLSPRNKICAKSFKDLFKINDLVLLKRMSPLSEENNIFAQTLAAPDKKFTENSIYKIVTNNRLNGGLLVMNYLDGRVLAMVGGYSFLESKFNRTTQANRQIGSLIKIFIYLSALENNIEPNNLFSDQPMEITVGNQVWRPKNFGNKFLGDITMQESFEKSRNLSTLRIAQKIGLKNLAEILKRFNIHQNPPKFLPIALGAIESTLIKTTSAIATIANNGKRVLPSLIDVIKDQNGRILYLRDNQKCVNCNTNTEAPQLLNLNNEQIADLSSIYQIQSLLNSTIEYGNANKIKKQVPNMTLGGKTGTTNESRDVWFVGFSKVPELAFGVYLGYDTPKTLGHKATGNSIASPIFAKFMNYIYQDEMNKISNFKELQKDKSSKQTTLVTTLLSPESYKLVYMDGKMCLKIKRADYQYTGYYPSNIYYRGKLFNQSIFDFDTKNQEYNNSWIVENERLSEKESYTIESEDIFQDLEPTLDYKNQTENKIYQEAKDQYENKNYQENKDQDENKNYQEAKDQYENINYSSSEEESIEILDYDESIQEDDNSVIN